MFKLFNLIPFLFDYRFFADGDNGGSQVDDPSQQSSQSSDAAGPSPDNQSGTGGEPNLDSQKVDQGGRADTDTAVVDAAAGGDDNYILLNLPPRDDPNYSREFGNLSFEDQLKVEKELNALNEKTDPELERRLNEKLSGLSTEEGKNKEGDEAGTGDDSADDKGDKGAGQGDEKPGDGKAEGEGAEEKVEPLNQEEFNALPERAQKILTSMDGEIKRLELFDTPDVQQGMKVMFTDPVIKHRLDQLKEGHSNPNAVTDFMQKKYNPNEHVKFDELSQLDFSSPEKQKESMEAVSNMLFEAAQRGFNIAKVQGDQRWNNYKNQIETKVKIEKQLTEMVSDNPSMKSDLAFEHKDHPLATFFNWVGDNMSADQFAKMGVKNVFIAYQTASGNMKNTVDSAVKEERKKIFLNIEKADESARDMSKDTQKDTTPTGQMYKGIDLNRYKSDSAYRQRMYEGADWPTQQNLETFVVTGDYPKEKPKT